MKLPSLPRPAPVDRSQVRAGLAGRAEDIYQTLDEDQQSAARQLFLRLVTVNEDQGQARRPGGYATRRPIALRAQR